MLRFCQDSNDPLYILLLKYEQTPSMANVKQEIIFSIDSSIAIPNMSSFCIPQEKFDPTAEGEVKFIFYLKSNDLYPTYGYVIQLIRNQKRTIYCLLSPYYYPQKLFSIITNFLLTRAPEQKLYLARNVKPNFSVQENLYNENELILNGIKQLISLFDPGLIGYLIVYLVLDFHIIITASNFEILSLFVFAILSTIHPLIWPGVFIPVLPESMSDTILAPFPYIIGMHNSIVGQAQSEDVERHILINIESKTMEFYPDRMKFPKKIKASVESFKKKISNLSLEKYMKFTQYSRELVLDVISYVVGKPPDKPHKIYKHWNILKGCHNLEPFPQMVCQSQLVLNLMREIENEEESLVFKAYFGEQPVEETPAPPRAVFDKISEKRSKYFRQRSGTNYQQKAPNDLLSEYKPPSNDKKPPRIPTQSVKLTQPIEHDSSIQNLVPSEKASSGTKLLNIQPPTQQKPPQSAQQSFNGIKTIESLALLFASKYENGGCIDSRFKKKDFKTNAGIETPETLSFANKLTLYNNGFNANDNNNNNNTNTNANTNTNTNTNVNNNRAIASPSARNNDNDNSNSNSKSSGRKKSKTIRSTSDFAKRPPISPFKK